MAPTYLNDEIMQLLPKKIINKRDEGKGMPTPAKTTLNVLYRLTTEMGECPGCENSNGMPQGQGQRHVPYG